MYEIFDLGMYQTDAKAERCAATVSGCHCMERIDLFASNFASVPYQSATAATARVWREGEGTKVNNVMGGLRSHGALRRNGSPQKLPDQQRDGISLG